MIVIGICKKYFLWDYFFGSVIIQFLIQSLILVLVILEGCVFKFIKKIVFVNVIMGEEIIMISYFEKLVKDWKVDLQQVFVNIMLYDFLYNK